MTAPQRLLVAAAVAGVMASASVVAAQTPATPGQAAAPGQADAPAKSKPAEPPPVERPAYTYEPEGRRDPFISLLARGSDPASASSRPAGVPGLLINEITVKGIVRDRNGFLAIIQGPDTTKTFIVRNGEQVMDGAVKTITVDTVVFAQDVNDPLSIVKQREVSTINVESGNDRQKLWTDCRRARDREDGVHVRNNEAPHPRCGSGVVCVCDARERRKQLPRGE